MGRLLDLDPTLMDSVSEEVLATFEDLAPTDVIPGLVVAIRMLAAQTKLPEQVLDEVADLLADPIED